MLYWEPGVPVAVVEVKDNNHTVSHGLQQALGYAEILQVPSAFSSNGDAFAAYNKVPAPNEDIETEFTLDAFLPPDQLWQRYKQFRGITDQNEKLVIQSRGFRFLEWGEVSAAPPFIGHEVPIAKLTLVAC
ncbi:hypothetical protein BJL95_20800 [Methylomonas sp. LWB]|nr:hypothetical protein [Methylomonas sp. LWB]OHX37117.1 hypothetical protein BJL95_20800 [Methylomonas sp. LWB]